MVRRKIRIGSMKDVHQYDDTDFDSAIETDHQIQAGAPSDPDGVLRLDDIAGDVGQSLWPIGSVFLSVVATNPNSLLGFGTWVRIAEGQFLVGYKSGDSDFDPVENTGGSKTHDHPSTPSGGPSGTETVDNNLDSSTVAVASDIHTHDVDLASIDHLPPFFVIYAWKRTA